VFVFQALQPRGCLVGGSVRRGRAGRRV
jgi:hypothetical protein